MSTETITIRLSREEIAQLDELRGDGVSRSAFVRELSRRAGPIDDAPTCDCDEWIAGFDWQALPRSR